MLRRLTFSAVYACLASSGVCAETPEHFVQRVYAERHRHPLEFELLFLDQQLAAHWKSLEKSGVGMELPGLAAAITRGQDDDIKKVAVATFEKSREQARVRAKFRNFGTPYELVFVLTTAGASWKISDVCTTGGAQCFYRKRVMQCTVSRLRTAGGC